MADFFYFLLLGRLFQRKQLAYQNRNAEHTSNKNLPEMLLIFKRTILLIASHDYLLYTIPQTLHIYRRWLLNWGAMIGSKAHHFL